MIQLHLFKKLAKDIKKHVQPNIEINSQAMQWYANIVTVARRNGIRKITFG